MLGLSLRGLEGPSPPTGVRSSDPNSAEEDPGNKPAPTHTQQQLLPVVTADSNPWSVRGDNNRHTRHPPGGTQART